MGREDDIEVSATRRRDPEDDIEVPATRRRGPEDDIRIPADSRPSERLNTHEPERSGLRDRGRNDIRLIDPRLTRANYLIAGALEDLRPGRSPTEVTDDELIASRGKLSEALALSAEHLSEQVSLSGQSGAEAESYRAFLTNLGRVRRSDLLKAEIPRDPERRGRFVRGLRIVAAALAAALLEFVLQTVLGALGVGDALEGATLAGVDAVREVVYQLKEAWPALSAPAMFGSQFVASTILLNEASELLEAVGPFSWSPGAPVPEAQSAGQSGDLVGRAVESADTPEQLPEVPAPESDGDLLDRAVELADRPDPVQGPSGINGSQADPGPGPPRGPG